MHHNYSCAYPSFLSAMYSNVCVCMHGNSGGGNFNCYLFVLNLCFPNNAWSEERGKPTFTWVFSWLHTGILSKEWERVMKSHKPTERAGGILFMIIICTQPHWCEIYFFHPQHTALMLSYVTHAPAATASWWWKFMEKLLQFYLSITSTRLSKCIRFPVVFLSTAITNLTNFNFTLGAWEVNLCQLTFKWVRVGEF